MIKPADMMAAMRGAGSGDGLMAAVAAMGMALGQMSDDLRAIRAALTTAPPDAPPEENQFTFTITATATESPYSGRVQDLTFTTDTTGRYGIKFGNDTPIYLQASAYVPVPVHLGKGYQINRGQQLVVDVLAVSNSSPDCVLSGISDAQQ